MFQGIKKILMAHDSSLCGWYAFEIAADLAKKYNAELYVLHVIDTTIIPDIPHKDLLLKPLKERAEKLEKEVLEKAKELGVELKYIVKEGKPVNKILETAEEIDADLVVLGSRGLGTSGYLLGSVSTKVIVACKRSVLIARRKDVPAASKL